MAVSDQPDRDGERTLIELAAFVYSGFRFCVAARELGKPVAAVNLGRTRADEMLALKIADDCGRALEDAVEEFSRPSRSGGSARRLPPRS